MDLHISTKKNNVHAILYTSNKQMELFYKRISHLHLPMVRDKIKNDLKSIGYNQGRIARTVAKMRKKGMASIKELNL